MFQEDDDAQLNKETWTVVKTLRYATLSRERRTVSCSVFQHGSNIDFGLLIEGDMPASDTLP